MVVYLRLLDAQDFGIQSIALLAEQIFMLVAGYAVANAMGNYYQPYRPSGKQAEAALV